MCLGARGAKQTKDAGRPNSSAIWPTEDAGMRSATWVIQVRGVAVSVT
jgi:hypothetical protein